MRIFLDSGVLLAAWRGHGRPADEARRRMADESCDHVSSENVLLELLPKPSFEKRAVEVDFYNEYFNCVSRIEPFSRELGREALALAKSYGLSAGDALNLASAVRQGAEEFLTSERPGKPMFRVKELRVISIFAEELPTGPFTCPSS